MLAVHCELVRQDERRIELRLPRAHERLLEKPYQDKLKSALQKHFGPKVQVSISVGDPQGNSPVEVQGRERERQRVGEREWVRERHAS